MKSPLPNHARPNVNAIMGESNVRTKVRLDEVKLPMDVVYKTMVKMGLIPQWKIFEGKCCYCRETCLNNTIRECEKF